MLLLEYQLFDALPILFPLRIVMYKIYTSILEEVVACPKAKWLSISLVY